MSRLKNVKGSCSFATEERFKGFIWATHSRPCRENTTTTTSPLRKPRVCHSCLANQTKVKKTNISNKQVVAGVGEGWEHKKTLARDVFSKTTPWKKIRESA